MILRLFALLALLPSMISLAQDEPGRFGIVEGFWRPDLMCQMGMGWERLILNWAQHQPWSESDWNPIEVSERWRGEHRSCPREVVALLKNTPAWATDGIPNAGVPRGLYLPHDDPNNLWAGFARRAADYYGKRGVSRFIIWNEPDIQPGDHGYEFAGTIDDYFRLLQVAYFALRQVNPAARIHLAGTTYWHDVSAGRAPFLDRLLDRILEDADAAENEFYFHAASLHIYFRVDTVPQLVGLAREALDERGLHEKAIWINETNAAPTHDPQWRVRRTQFQLDLEQQAAYIVQAAALALASGVERFAVYKLLDQNLPSGHESFGILTPGNWQPRPAVAAYQTAIQLLSPVTKSELMQTRDTSIARMFIEDNYALTVAWARRAQESVLRIGATADQAWLVEQDGAMQTLKPVEGVYRLDLPPAKCSGRDGCFIGGAVKMLLQTSGASAIAQTAPSRQQLAAA